MRDSAVVTTLELAWKARWLMMRLTISEAMSTLDDSKVLPEMLSKTPELARPTEALPDSVVGVSRLLPLR